MIRKTMQLGLLALATAGVVAGTAYAAYYFNVTPTTTRSVDLTPKVQTLADALRKANENTTFYQNQATTTQQNLSAAKAKLATVYSQLGITYDESTVLSDDVLQAALSKIQSYQSAGGLSEEQIANLKQQIEALNQALADVTGGAEITTPEQVKEAIDQKVEKEVAKATEELTTELGETKQTLANLDDLLTNSGDAFDWLDTGALFHAIPDPAFIASATTSDYKNSSNFEFKIRQLGSGDNKFYVYSAYDNNTRTAWIWGGVSWLMARSVADSSGTYMLVYRDGYWQKLRDSLERKTMPDSSDTYLVVYDSSRKKFQKAFLPALPDMIDRDKLQGQQSGDDKQYGVVSELSWQWVPYEGSSTGGTIELTVSTNVKKVSDNTTSIFRYVPHEDQDDPVYSGTKDNRVVVSDDGVWVQVQ